MDQKLVQKIYQTVTDDTVLPGLMDDFEQMFGGYSSALLLGTPEQNQILQSNMNPEVTAIYNDHYGQQDLWFQRAEQSNFSGVTSGRLGLGDHAEFDQGYFTDVLEASDCQDCLGTFLFGDKRDAMGVLTIYRSFKAEPFQRSDVERMSTYAGHLRHAFGLKADFTSLTNDVLKLQTALSRINGPVMFLAEDGGLVWANAQAEAELASQSLIKIQSGRLCAANSHFSTQLGEAIRSVFHTRMAATVPVCLGEDSAPCMIYLTPLAADVSDTASSFTGLRSTDQVILAKLKTPPSASAQSKAVLRSFYALTDRQVDVAFRLSNGDTIAEIAEREHLSVGTVRNHVKAIFEKTGTSRQTELVRLILAL